MWINASEVSINLKAMIEEIKALFGNIGILKEVIGRRKDLLKNKSIKDGAERRR